MSYFIFGYFSTKLGTSVDGHEKNNTRLFISAKYEPKLEISHCRKN
jgi:hypothetical protein